MIFNNNIIWQFVIIYKSFAFHRNKIYTYNRLNPSNAIAVFASPGQTKDQILKKCFEEYTQVISLSQDVTKLENYNQYILNTKQYIIYKGNPTKYKHVKEIYQNNNITGTIIYFNDSHCKNSLATKNIIKCIKKYNSSKRIVLISSIGCGSSFDKSPLLLKLLINTIYNNKFYHKNKQEQLFFSGIGKSLDFCIIRSGKLNNKLESSIAIIDKGYGDISRESLASICYDAISSQTFPYIKTVISVVNMNNKHNKIENQYIPIINWSEFAKKRLP